MVCIYCGSPTQVINSRAQKQLNQVWRRRRCSRCHNVFTTHEAVDLSGSLMVAYSPKRILPFSRDTLLLSIYDSCKHRPTAVEDAAALTQTVVNQLRIRQKEGSLTRSVIIRTVTEILGRFDTSAATIYQAYHPLIQDVAK